MPRMSGAENFDQTGSSQENEKTAGEELLKEKILAAWGAARDQFNVPNNHRLAELFYKSLYQPEELESEQIVDRPEFNRTGTLTSKSDLNSEIIPEKEEFIEAIRRAMTRDTKFDECLHTGAMEFLKELSDYGPITMWTRGDVYGQPEAGYQGSFEQFKRMAISGVAELRRKVAKEKDSQNKDIIAVAASENKMSLVKGILETYREKGIKEIIIFDDQLKNIIQFLEIVKDQTDFKFTPVWVRQGNFKNSIPKDSGKSLDEWAKEFNSVPTVAEAIESLQTKGILSETEKNELGFIVDYDDVISDDQKRKAEQVKSVLKMMKEKGWLK